MSADTSIIGYFLSAGLVVKSVMLLLVVASIASWTIIFQRGFFIKQAKKTLKQFEDKFWSGVDLTKLYADLSDRPNVQSGLETIFHSGFKEFLRTKQQGHTDPDRILESTQRAMRIVQSREQDKLEQNLSFLATIGSTSPYIGLFGTVWGIMASFHALGGVQQATIAMVAPGISEALVATAMGLFAAIPAVIFYNRYANQVERLLNHYDTFQEEFSTVLHREAYEKNETAQT